MPWLSCLVSCLSPRVGFFFCIFFFFQAQEKIDELTVLDRWLYDAGAAAFDKVQYLEPSSAQLFSLKMGISVPRYHRNPCAEPQRTDYGPPLSMNNKTLT